MNKFIFLKTRILFPAVVPFWKRTNSVLVGWRITDMVASWVLMPFWTRQCWWCENAENLWIETVIFVENAVKISFKSRESENLHLFHPFLEMFIAKTQLKDWQVKLAISLFRTGVATNGCWLLRPWWVDGFPWSSCATQPDKDSAQWDQSGNSGNTERCQRILHDEADYIQLRDSSQRQKKTSHNDTASIWFMDLYSEDLRTDNRSLRWIWGWIIHDLHAFWLVIPWFMDIYGMICVEWGIIFGGWKGCVCCCYYTVYLPNDIRIFENRYDSQCSLGFLIQPVHIEMLIHDLDIISGVVGQRKMNSWRSARWPVDWFELSTHMNKLYTGTRQ